MRFQLTPEQVPEDMRWLCEIVGMQHFLEIIDMAGGEFIYLPKRETLEKPLRHEAIRREYDGTNARQLSRKYGITERHVRTIVKDVFPRQ
ncbi:MAG: DNA-binding protein [Clostridia bacterium]|nr:DNA-binding protein [Clostridia bacterium]